MTATPGPLGADLLGDDAALVVTGSLAAKEADRTHGRDAIHPVHVVDVGGTRTVEGLDGFGEFGVGALVVAPDGASALCSDGDRLWSLDLVAGGATELPVRDLVDVHEIEVDGDVLLLANTGRDELVELDAAGRELDRVPLAGFRAATPAAEGAVDRFHANQFLRGPGGRRWALVHHVEGYQLLRKAATKVLKVQGDGGLVALDDGERRALRLTAPHSVTAVGEGWWIFDSGRSEVRRYDGALGHVGTAPTGGWGRGAAVDEARGVVWAGMSPIRRRYLGVVPGPHVDVPCTVEALRASDAASLGAVAIPDVEQVNNVYLVPRSVGDALVEFAP